MLSVDTAIRIESTPQGKRYIHLCLDCKKELKNSSSHLKMRTGYCNPCFKKRQYHPTQRLLTTIKHSAKGRTSVSITEAELVQLVELATCHYCGGPIQWRAGRINLDRKDSDKGYDFDNVVVCCFDCNKIKSNILNYEEAKIAIDAVRIYRMLSDSDKSEFHYSILSWTDSFEWLTEMVS